MTLVVVSPPLQVFQAGAACPDSPFQALVGLLRSDLAETRDLPAAERRQLTEHFRASFAWEALRPHLPLRLAVPWKYGFKSIKAIVKIELVDYMPDTLWTLAARNEYGFYANVNPEVDHPRWSQSAERRIGEVGRRKTLLFNGYEKEVASLYAGMDLEKNF